MARMPFPPKDKMMDEKMPFPPKGKKASSKGKKSGSKKVGKSRKAC